MVFDPRKKDRKRPNIGLPINSNGNDGDIELYLTPKGLVLYGKFNGEWYPFSEAQKKGVVDKNVKTFLEVTNSLTLKNQSELKLFNSSNKYFSSFKNSDLATENVQYTLPPTGYSSAGMYLAVGASNRLLWKPVADVLSDLGITSAEILDWTADQGSTNIHPNNVSISHDKVTDFDSEVNALAQVKIDALVDSAPGALNTLNELAAALNDDASFSTTVTNSIATKVGLTGDETIAGHKKFSDDVQIAGAAADPATTDHVSLGVSSGALRIHTDSGYLTIGPQNSGWNHFYTDREKYYFNRKIVVDEGIVASYDEDLILRRDHDDTTYNQITIGDDTLDIKLDNTSRLAIDANGQVDLSGDLVLRGEKGIFIENLGSPTGTSTSYGGSIIQPATAMYRTADNAHTGFIKIVVPSGTGANPRDMLTFWVDVFDYASGDSFSAYISGYNYEDAGSNEWHNCDAMILGTESHRDFTVRFCHDGTNPCITIGETNTTWNYLQVTVRNVQVGFTADIDDFKGDWTISVETTLPTYVDETVSGNFPIASRTIGTADIATTVTLTDQSSDSTCFPIFSTADTGDRNLHTDSSALTYNASTGKLTSTGLGASTLNLSTNLFFDGAGTHYLKHNGGTASSDNFTFRFSDNEDAVIIRGDGRVGIGTTSPSQGLHVVDAGGIVAEFESSDNTTAMIHIENSAGEDGYIGVTNDGLVFSGQDYNSNNMIVDTSGNVGIGTTSPGADLQIHSTSGTKLWLTAAGSNPSDAASLRFAEAENGTNYVQLSYDGSANTLSVDSNNNNDMSVWDRVNNRVTHGAQSRFYRAWPQAKFSDDSGTDTVELGLTNNTFLTKSSDANIDFQWHNSSAESILYLDSSAKTVTIGEGAQSTYNLKIGANGRMNMPLKGLEFENAHGYFASTGDMFLPLFINATQTDLLRFQTPITWEYWDYSGSAWVDDISNVGNLKNMLDGRRATSYSVTNTKRKFRFVIERQSTWADDHLFYIENTWSSITSGLSWDTAAAGGNPITPTMQVERLDGSFDASDDSNNDWTTNSGITTDWHTTGIVTGFGLMMYYSTGMHNTEKHIRVTVTIPEYADTSKTFAIKNIGAMSSYSSQNTNQQPFLQDFDRNATGYGHLNIPSGHDYKINSVSKLSATTLGSGVVNSSLTNVGTLTGLTSSGAVNINGSSGAMLNITNTGDTAQLKIESQGSGAAGRSNIKFNTNGGDWEFGARNSNGGPDNAFYIYENDSTAYRLVIADGGNIGIGTTAPSQKLHVIGNVKVDGDVIIDADHKLRSNTDDTWNFIEFDDDSGSPENQTLISSKTNTGVIVDGNNNGTGQFEVLKGGTDGTATELFRIENDGDAVFTGDVYIPGEKKIQFDSTDTTIYTNSDNPEDLYIESDEDMYIRPDDNLIIAHGTTNYVTFKGDEREVEITGDLSATEITSGAVIWERFAFANSSAASGTYHFKDVDDTTNNAGLWDASDTDPTSFSYLNLPGQYIVPENCTLKAMYVICTNFSSNDDIKIAIYHGTPNFDTTSDTTLALAGLALNVSIGTMRRSYGGNATYNVDLDAGDIVVPTFYQNSGSNKAVRGNITLKFVTR